MKFHRQFQGRFLTACFSKVAGVLAGGSVNTTRRLAGPWGTGRAVAGLAMLFSLSAVFLAACGSEPLPAAGRADFPQPTFVSVKVTPAPVSPTATPWPNLRGGSVRMLPEGIDPEFYSRASSEEVIELWKAFLTGASMEATSGRFYFRGRGRFDGVIHLCPGGMGYLDGDPSGSLKWSLSTSAGAWYEVALTHGIPTRNDSVTFVLSVHEGLPARSGATETIDFIASDRCLLSEPGVQPSLTVDERRLVEKADLVVSVVEEIPWVDGQREFPGALTVEGSHGLAQETGVNYWNAYLSGSVVDAVAFEFGTFVLTEAFSGSLHLCDERVAILDGTPSGFGQWAVQSTGSNPYDAKIVFTLPGDRRFRTLVLGVDGEVPIRMGRDSGTGLIAATPLDVRESSECGPGSGS